VFLMISPRTTVPPLRTMLSGARNESSAARREAPEEIKRKIAGTSLRAEFMIEEFAIAL
jgi:hypothetical protein